MYSIPFFLEGVFFILDSNVMYAVKVPMTDQLKVEPMGYPNLDSIRMEQTFI